MKFEISRTSKLKPCEEARWETIGFSTSAEGQRVEHGGFVVEIDSLEALFAFAKTHGELIISPKSDNLHYEQFYHQIEIYDDWRE